MERFVKGDVVVLPFPFSDLSATKKRPAVIMAVLQGDDVILCQITSADRSDACAVPLQQSDFQSGKLNVESKIRPNRIFTAEKSILLYKAGSLKNAKVKEVEKVLLYLFTQ